MLEPCWGASEIPQPSSIPSPRSAWKVLPADTPAPDLTCPGQVPPGRRAEIRLNATGASRPSRPWGSTRRPRCAPSLLRGWLSDEVRSRAQVRGLPLPHATGKVATDRPGADGASLAPDHGTSRPAAAQRWLWVDVVTRQRGRQGSAGRTALWAGLHATRTEWKKKAHPLPPCSQLPGSPGRWANRLLARLQDRTGTAEPLPRRRPHSALACGGGPGPEARACLPP